MREATTRPIGVPPANALVTEWADLPGVMLVSFPTRWCKARTGQRLHRVERGWKSGDGWGFQAICGAGPMYSMPDFFDSHEQCPETRLCLRCVELDGSLE